MTFIGQSGRTRAEDVMLERQAQLGKYEIMEELGMGAMAMVYKAKNTEDGGVVAIKVPDRPLLTNVRALHQFIEDGQALIRLRHPNIIPVHSVGQQDELPYIVMDYVPGFTLSQELKKREKFSLEEAAEILLPLANALDYSHNEQMFHCDVRPGNIRMAGGRIPMLVDFLQTASGDEGKPVGSVRYMSPEQARDERPSGRSDQYALAIVAYEMLSGHVPFDGDNPYAIVLQQRDCEPPIPTEWSDSLKAVMRRALDKDPQKRFISCIEFVRSLKETGRKISLTTMKSEVGPTSATHWIDLRKGDERANESVQEPPHFPSEPLSMQASSSTSRFNAAATLAADKVLAQLRKPVSVAVKKLKTPRYAGLATGGVVSLVLIAILFLTRHDRPHEQARLSSAPSGANLIVPVKAEDQGTPTRSVSTPAASFSPTAANSGGLKPGSSQKSKETAGNTGQNASVVNVSTAGASVIEDSKGKASQPSSAAVPAEPRSDQTLKIVSGMAPGNAAAPLIPQQVVPPDRAAIVNQPSSAPSSAPANTTASTPSVQSSQAVVAAANPTSSTASSHLSGIVRPRLISSVPPTYPASASVHSMGATRVTVKFTVDKDGKVKNPKFVNGIFSFFDTAAACVKQWRYAPATQDGQPIEFELTETIWFHL